MTSDFTGFPIYDPELHKSMMKAKEARKKADLGKSSDWDFEPPEVEKCRLASDHLSEDVPIANSHAKHRVTCEICKYTYTYLCHQD